MKIIIAFIFAVAITSCGSSSKPGEKYPDQVRANFINGCAAKLPDGYKKNCECMLEQIEKKYSIAEYTKLEEDMKAGKDVSAFMALADSARQICFPKK
ncbi:MAG: hypothetical protein IPL54_00965 [Chitinophagaceae bacterium]|nr:hypothetical protein [Chitinophagaceae bacterium]